MTIASVAPEAIDLSHHVNATSKARQASPLKALLSHMGQPNMCSLAGGLPHPSFFPFESLHVKAYNPDGDLAVTAPKKTQDELIDLSVERYGSNGDDLATMLQYGSGTGSKAILEFARAFTAACFSPGYKCAHLAHLGCTDAWTKVVRLLCEPGDHILTEQYTFPSSMAVWIPLGVKGAPVKMDQDGMRSDDLRRILANWETEHPGMKRPHLMYIVPVGSNPTGSTMPAYRRKEIYDICVEYDVIICEDDPYTFLQFPTYQLSDAGTDIPAQPQSIDEFKAALVPSFLKFDTQGRVIRLDTFSKTLAPGLRLGWFTAAPMLLERILRGTEVETQSPSGWSQIIVSELLGKWGIEGYLRWLSNLRDQYRARRNQMCDALVANFDVREASTTNVKGAEGLVAFVKGTDVPVFSFVPPTGGMFIWLTMYISKAPGYIKLSEDSACADPEQVFMDQLWQSLVDVNVLLAPGHFYVPWQGTDKMTTATRGEERGVGHFRLAFSTAVKDEMEAAIERLATVFRQTWGL